MSDDVCPRTMRRIARERGRLALAVVLDLGFDGTRARAAGTPSHVMRANRSEPRRPLSINVPGILGTLGVFFVALVCVRLGFWQLDRLAQRDTINEQVGARLELPALALTRWPADTSGLGYRRVEVQGELDAERSIVLAGRSRAGAPGVHLLTPLHLEDGTAVLVNRGWVPSADGTSIDLAAFTLDSLAGAGIVFPLASAGAAATRSTPTREFQHVWFRVDVTTLRGQFPYPISDYEVRLLPPASAAQAPPVRLDPPELDRGPHLGYAIQWFSFAAIFLIGWGAMVARRGGGQTVRRG